MYICIYAYIYAHFRLECSSAGFLVAHPALLKKMRLKWGRAALTRAASKDPAP